MSWWFHRVQALNSFLACLSSWVLLPRVLVLEMFSGVTQPLWSQVTFERYRCQCRRV